MLNKTILKKFADGTGVPGETSNKSLSIEHGYALVFHGKVPYMPDRPKELLAWRDLKGKYCIKWFSSAHPASEYIETLKWFLSDAEVVTCPGPTMGFRLATKVSRTLIEALNLPEGEERDKFVKKKMKEINEIYTMLEASDTVSDFWIPYDSAAPLKAITTVPTLIIDLLHDGIKQGIMERRMVNG